MKKEDIDDSETKRIQRLDTLVQQSIVEEQLLTTKLKDLESDEGITLGQKVADAVARFGGSWTFIIGFCFFIFVWIVLNSVWLKDRNLDPYPFILLNLILSCVAALQAPVIMMSQNRREHKDRQRAQSDYMINLKSEMEVRGLHSKFDILLADEMKALFKVQQAQMDILKKLQKKLVCEDNKS